MTLVSWTLSFLRPYRGRTLVIASLSVLEIGLAALAPWPLKLIVDTVLGGAPVPGPIAMLLPTIVAASAAALLRRRARPAFRRWLRRSHRHPAGWARHRAQRGRRLPPCVWFLRSWIAQYRMRERFLK